MRLLSSTLACLVFTSLCASVVGHSADGREAEDVDAEGTLGSNGTQLFVGDDERYATEWSWVDSEEQTSAESDPATIFRPDQLFEDDFETEDELDDEEDEREDAESAPISRHEEPFGDDSELDEFNEDEEEGENDTDDNEEYEEERKDHSHEKRSAKKVEHLTNEQQQRVDSDGQQAERNKDIYAQQQQQIQSQIEAQRHGGRNWNVPPSEPAAGIPKAKPPPSPPPKPKAKPPPPPPPPKPKPKPSATKKKPDPPPKKTEKPKPKPKPNPDPKSKPKVINGCPPICVHYVSDGALSPQDPNAWETISVQAPRESPGVCPPNCRQYIGEGAVPPDAPNAWKSVSVEPP